MKNAPEIYILYGPYMHFSTENVNCTIARSSYGLSRGKSSKIIVFELLMETQLIQNGLI